MQSVKSTHPLLVHIHFKFLAQFVWSPIVEQDTVEHELPFESQTQIGDDCAQSYYVVKSPHVHLLTALKVNWA